jgi:VPS62-like protein
LDDLLVDVGRRYLDIVFAAVLLLLAGCGAQSPSQSHATPARVAAIVTRYAPVVYLAHGERWRPDSAADFLAHASLVLDRPDAATTTQSTKFERRDGSCANSVLERSITDGGASLATATVDPETAVIRGGVLFCSPIVGEVSHNVAKARRSSTGLVLRSDETIAHGEPTAATPGLAEVPVYSVYVPHRFISYWFFYPYNGFEHRYLPFLPPLVELHQGDWEHIVVELKAPPGGAGEDEPTAVDYYQHGCAARVFAASLGADGALVAGASNFEVQEATHPVVYSALGGHASYPSAGSHLGSDCGLFEGRGDVTGRGERWATATDVLDARAQPWWGFTGNWGTGGKHGGRFDISPPVGPVSPSPLRRR